MTAKKFLGSMLLLIAALSITFSIICFTAKEHSVKGGSESNYSYNVEFYTDIQNAAAQTARNVLRVEEKMAFLTTCVGFVFLLASLTFASCGVYQLMLAAGKEIQTTQPRCEEQKKKRQEAEERAKQKAEKHAKMIAEAQERKLTEKRAQQQAEAQALFFDEDVEIVFLIEKEEMWGKMLLDVLHDNNIPAIGKPVFGFAVTINAGKPERLRIYVPSQFFEKASELAKELFPQDETNE